MPLSTLLISIAVSAVVGYAVIAFLLRYLQTRTLKIFIVYRIAFGIFILLLAFLHRGTARSAPARPVQARSVLPPKAGDLCALTDSDGKPPAQ